MPCALPIWLVRSIKCYTYRMVSVLVSDPPDVLDATCPARQVLELVADKWAVLILYALERGPRRTGDLQRTVDGVSAKMLTQTLRDLERNGLLTRTVHPVVPPKVEYALTPLGQTLGDTLGALCAWAQDNLAEVEMARARHDSRAPG